MADDDEIPEQIEAVSMAKNSSWEVVSRRGSKLWNTRVHYLV